MAAARQTRATWNKLIDDSDQPIWVVDAEWRIVLANPALQAWWGDGGEQLVGLKICYGLPAATAEAKYLASALAPDPMVFAGRAVQTTIVHPRDPRASLPIRWFPLHDADGLVQSALAWEVSHADTYQGSPARITTDTDWHALLAQHRARSRDRATLNRFVGESLAMQSLRARTALAARQASHAWIIGPAGSGRRTLARAIHALHPAMDVPCVEWDAALLTPELLDRQVSEFVATNQARTLKVPSTPVADVLLLNVEHLTAAHFRELRHLPGRTPVRLILTSNVAPEKLPYLDQWPATFVAQWSVLTIDVPALGSRLADLPLVVQQILEECNLAGNKQRRGCSLAALELLASYRWPGDVAELSKVLRAAHIAAVGVEIQPADLPTWLRQAESALSSPRPAPQGIDLDQQLADIERELLGRALRLAEGNKTQAAKLVGWTRQRLLRRAEELGIISSAATKNAAQEPEYIVDLPFEPEGE
jgi:two-component system response regulator AtoC